MRAPRSIASELPVKPLFDRRALGFVAHNDGYFRYILDGLPAAIYATDADGKLTYFNQAATELWGYRPELGKAEWCGSWKLYWPDGTELAHAECPMARAIKERRAVRGMEAIAERPDGTRVPFIPYPTPLFDNLGNLVGAVNMLVDITDRKRTEEFMQHMAAVVESSDDAIVTKDLNGVIKSWNRGAEQLFGYTADEVIGKPITILVPEDRPDEEPGILARLRRGERIEHYETIRRRKDGTLINISLTVSPVKNPAGVVIGASKVARDITERRRAHEQQQLLLREMNHRIKNLFTLFSGIVTLSERSATTPQALASAVRARLGALDRAQSVVLGASEAGGGTKPTSLHALIRAILSPHDGQTDEGSARIVISGADVALTGGVVTSFALLLHEFATNAAKYGALSSSAGYVDIACLEDRELFLLTWAEHRGPPVEHSEGREGFGTLLERGTVRSHLGGEITRDWKPEGVVIRLSVPRDRIEG
jgi:PAS domain S-box-containing protein